MVYSKKIENHVMLSGEEKENGGKTTIGLIKPGFHMSGKSRTIWEFYCFPTVPDFADYADASQISAMVGNHFRQMKTQICIVGDVGDVFRSLPIP